MFVFFVTVQTTQEYEETIRSKNENNSNIIVTTEIVDGRKCMFYYGEDYHQQYFAKNPESVNQCSMKGLGINHKLQSLKGLYDSEEMEKEFNTNKAKQNAVLEPEDNKYKQLENLYDEGNNTGSQREH